MKTINQSKITLNETDFNVFQAGTKFYMDFEQIAQAVDMSSSFMEVLGCKAQHGGDVEFSGPQTLEIDGNEIELIEVDDAIKYWVLAMVRGDSKKAWGFLGAILAEA
jgi:hypothetical protein